MRGKPSTPLDQRADERITPADAGKTVGRKASAGRFPDHPRGCGENRQDDELREKEIGSPPRMRGKRKQYLGQKNEPRITPADAGKTWDIAFYVGKTQDHPRGCGENSCCTCARSRFAGSPPRMRGKHCVSVYVALKAGITPADAGKTLPV